jgi:hypothetical protein
MKTFVNTPDLHIKKCPICDERPDATQYEENGPLYVKHSCKDVGGNCNILVLLSVWNKRPLEDKLIEHCEYLFTQIVYVFPFNHKIVETIGKSVQFMAQFYPEEDK